MPSVEIVGGNPLECTAATDDKGLKLQPIFYGRGYEPATIADIVVKDDDGKRVGIYALRINGGSLKVSVHDRTNPVVPVWLRQKKNKKGATDGKQSEQRKQ